MYLRVINRYVAPYGITNQQHTTPPPTNDKQLRQYSQQADNTGTLDATSMSGIGSAASQSSSKGETAKRVITSILETSGLVCGSLKDTVQEKLEDNEMDMKWVEGEIDNIKNKIGPKMEKPREHILNFAEKACAGSSNNSSNNGSNKGEPLSSSPMRHMAGQMASGAMVGSFLDDNTLDGTVTTAGDDGGGGGFGENGTAQRSRTLTIDTDIDDQSTMASTLMTTDTPPKHKSRFAPVINEDRKLKKQAADAKAAQIAAGGGTVVIGLCLSRKNATLGHPDTVTRQTAFDFNELQDRDYKYVSSTDDSGWLAGGGERGDPYISGIPKEFRQSGSDEDSSSKSEENNRKFGAGHKVPAPDRVHIPIIQINAASSVVIDEIVAALARGEIFIPEVSIMPETLSVNSNTSQPDLVVQFGCEKNDDANPEEWPNWPLEFLHNQLFEYFMNMGAQWSKRPFQITLARKVRWMTARHMNKYFARSEQVINSWREKGPQYLQPPYSDDSSRGVILEEITRPHGIYLIQNGVPTNYFAPNFQPPYTTKMSRSLIRNVINKSWDMKHRDWLSEPVPRMRGPVQIISSVLGCANPSGPLSPVEENASANNVGAFHRRSDFDLVAESETPEHADVRNKKKSKETPHEKKQQQQKQKTPSQRRRLEERGDMKLTSSVPSDEWQSTRPGGAGTTESLSLEETLTDLANDPISANRTGSNSVESPGRGKQWSDSSSQDDVDKNHFFNGVKPGRTSSYESAKDVVSCSEDSFVREQQRQQHLTEMQLSKEKRVDKFARTKVCCVKVSCS